MKLPAYVVLIVLGLSSHARGQAAADAIDVPPRIGPFVIDLHGTIPFFPSDDAQLAASRGLVLGELPGSGFGADVGVHVYLLKWRAITFGLGGQAIAARSRNAVQDAGPLAPLRPVTERLVSASPQLSFNFGTGRGWSYLSGGIGRSVWSIHPDAEPEGPADQERLRTFNYGGGARWFAKKHLAFSVDARFYSIDPGTPIGARPGSPRTLLLAIGAGVSIK
jgi:hypothetical protein